MKILMLGKAFAGIREAQTEMSPGQAEVTVTRAGLRYAWMDLEVEAARRRLRAAEENAHKVAAEQRGSLGDMGVKEEAGTGSWEQGAKAGR